MLFQDASSYNYLSNGYLPVSGWDDAADLQDSMVSGTDQFLPGFFFNHIARNFFRCYTSNNRGSGSALDYRDPRLSLLCQVGDDVIRPCKICGGCQIPVPRFIHLLPIDCPIQSRLQSVLGVCSFHVERK